MNRRAFAIVSLIISVFIVGTFSPGLSIWGLEYNYYVDSNSGTCLQHTTSFLAFLKDSFFTTPYKAFGVITVLFLMVNLVFYIIFTIRFKRINRHLLWQAIQCGLIVFTLVLCVVNFYKNSYLQSIGGIIVALYLIYYVRSYLGYRKFLEAEKENDKHDEKSD